MKEKINFVAHKFTFFLSLQTLNADFMAPRINLVNLNGFPSEFHSSGKIEVEHFIKAANEVISVIESFGKLFSPVILKLLT